MFHEIINENHLRGHQSLQEKNTLKNELEQKSIGEKNVPNVEIFTGQPDLPLCFLHGTFQDRN